MRSFALGLGMLLASAAAPAGADEAAAHATPRPEVAPAETAPLEPSSLEPSPLLWRIDRTPPSYVFGTIHVGDHRVLDLHDAVVDAFKACETFYAEIPMDAASQSMVMKRLVLPEAVPLAARLPEDLLARTSRWLESQGLALEPFAPLRLWAVAVGLTMIEAIKIFGDDMQPPLDQVLYQRAADAGKVVGGLETVEEQLGIFEALTPAEEMSLLGQTLTELEAGDASGEPFVETVMRLYLAGDEQALLDAAFELPDVDDPLTVKLRDRLIVARNRLMAERIVQHLEGNPKRAHFFAIGAGHFGEPQGILALLQAAGLKVDRVVPVASETTVQR